MIDVERLTRVIAIRRRVCSCTCPVAHGRQTGVCQQFIDPGQPMMLEQVNAQLDVARCLPCTEAIRAATRSNRSK